MSQGVAVGEGRELGRGDLVLTSSTLGNPPFPELVAAASAAGFAGLSLWPAHDWAAARDAGLSDQDLRTLLDDHGLVVNDVDCLVRWVGPGAPGEPPYFEEPEPAVLWAAAEALGARYVNVLLLGQKGTAEDDTAAALAEVCDEAAEHGMVATVEFAAGTLARDVPTAARIVAATGRPNASVLIDAWHLHYGRSTTEDVAATAPGVVRGVQLNDGPAERPEDFMHATRWARLAPGEGEFDLAGLVGALDRAGYQGPLSVEVFNQALVDELGLEGAARRVAAGARALIEGTEP